MTATRKTMKTALTQLGRAAIQAAGSPAAVSLASRTDMIETSRAAAARDERFQGMIRDGDRLRDHGDWPGAEAAYASALELYPYEPTFWVQHGHMAKEQNDFVRAEVSYRTAGALGAEVRDVREHLLFVMMRQDVDQERYPLRTFEAGPTALQVPGKPDVAMLARLLWHVGGVSDTDTVQLLRSCATCDQLMAAMIADVRFERANRDWLGLVGEDEL